MKENKKKLIKKTKGKIKINGKENMKNIKSKDFNIYF